MTSLLNDYFNFRYRNSCLKGGVRNYLSSNLVHYAQPNKKDQSSV